MTALFRELERRQEEQTDDQRILICAPLGKDAELSCTVLEKAGLSCCVCKDLDVLLEELRKGADAVLAVEEILPPAASQPLSEYIASQPAWSDVPVLVLT